MKLLSSIGGERLPPPPPSCAVSGRCRLTAHMWNKLQKTAYIRRIYLTYEDHGKSCRYAFAGAELFSAIQGRS